MTPQHTPHTPAQPNATDGAHETPGGSQGHSGGAMDTHVQQATGQTARWVWVVTGLTVLVAGFVKAMTAFERVPATVNGDTIPWPVPTWGVVVWCVVAVVGVLLVSFGMLIPGRVEP